MTFQNGPWLTGLAAILKVAVLVAAAPALHAAGFANLNAASADGILSADQFPGTDNGARINAAVAYWQANGGPCHIVLSQAGSISTAPDIPLGCTFELLAPQTLSVTWPWRHHGVIADFHGKKITTKLGPGVATFLIGKASSTSAVAGTVNTSGSTVTWVSGPDFSDVDLGDQIWIAGAGAFNIAAVNSATSISLAASAGKHTGADYVVLLTSNNTITNNPTNLPPTLKNLSLATAGPTGDAVRAVGVTGLTMENLTVYGPLSSASFASGLHMEGCILSHISGFSLAAAGVLLDIYSRAGFNSGSNHNRFYGGSMGNTGGNHAWSMQNSSNDNAMFGLAIEGNPARNGYADVGNTNNACYGCYLEQNGDGTSSASDILISGSKNALIDTAIVTAAGTQFNNRGSAIILKGTTTGSTIRNVTVAGNDNSYGAAIRCLAGGSGLLQSNAYSGVPGPVVGCRTSSILDGAGNVTIAGNLAASTVAVGAGSTINKILLGSASLTFGAISTKTCTDRSFTVRGALQTSGVAHASPAATLGNKNLYWSAWIAADNAVTVRVCNVAADSVIPKVVTWNAVVIQ